MILSILCILFMLTALATVCMLIFIFFGIAATVLKVAVKITFWLTLIFLAIILIAVLIV